MPGVRVSPFDRALAAHTVQAIAWTKPRYRSDAERVRADDFLDGERPREDDLSDQCGPDGTRITNDVADDMADEAGDRARERDL